MRNLNEREISHQSFVPFNPKLMNSPDYCHRRFELRRRKMAAKFHYVPTLGCHKQSGFKCTGYRPLTAGGRAAIVSMVRQRSMRWKPLYLDTQLLNSRMGLRKPWSAPDGHDVSFWQIRIHISNQFVMPDLIRHPAFFRMPDFAGMMMCTIHYDAEIGAPDDHSCSMHYAGTRFAIKAVAAPLFLCSGPSVGRCTFGICRLEVSVKVAVRGEDRYGIFV